LRQLDTPGAVEGAVADKDGVGSLAHKRCEGRIDLAAGVGVVGGLLALEDAIDVAGRAPVRVDESGP
jgi:hypothetical protein